MSTATAPAPPAAPTLDPAPVRGQAAALVVAPWAYVLTNALYAWMIRDGGTDLTGAGAVALAADNPGLTRLQLVLVIAGGLLMIPAMLGMRRLTPRGVRGARLARFGGAAMLVGYVCYACVAMTGYTIVAMGERGGPVADYAAVLDASMDDPAGFWVMLTFVFGNIVGNLLLVAGLLRSRAVPRWAPLAIGVWPVLHVLGLVFLPNEIPQVVGAASMAVGFAGCALALLRRG